VKIFYNLLLLSILVLFSTTFALAQNPNCPDVSEVLDLTSLATESGAIAAMNGAGLTLGGELLQVANTYNGGATADENAINDDHLTGCTGLKLGIDNATDGANTNMTTTYTLTGSVSDVCFRIIDIDHNDEIVINGSLNGTVHSFDAGQATFTLLDQSGNSCIDYINNNTFSSNCIPPEPNINDTTRGAMDICFTAPIDQLELTFYDKGTTTGDAYTLCDMSTCAAVTDLPIELAEFSVTENDCQANLYWRTVTEPNFSHFDIEKSTNGMDYTAIASIDSKGNQAIGAEYNFIDNQLAANNYYRLKMVDSDGLTEYSNIETITTNCASGVSISDVFPNPVRNMTSSVRFTSSINETEAKMVIIDALSRVVTQQTIEVIEGMNLINLDLSTLNSGTYYLFLEGDNWQTRVVKFVKQ